MSKNKFLKHIELLDENDLREELKMLYTRSAEVKNFYALELGEAKDRQRIYDKAKKEIEKKYLTKSYRKPRRPRIQKINAILRKLQKEAVFPYEMIDIYLHNCECAIKFMNEYYFRSTPLDNTILLSFEKALKIIMVENMYNSYEQRVYNILGTADYYSDFHKMINLQFDTIIEE